MAISLFDNARLAAADSWMVDGFTHAKLVSSASRMPRLAETITCQSFLFHPILFLTTRWPLVSELDAGKNGYGINDD